MGGADCAEQGRGQLPGVEAVLVEQAKAVRAGCELRQKPAQVFGGENAACIRDMRRECLQGGVSMKRHRGTGEIVKPFEKCGIDGDAVREVQLRQSQRTVLHEVRQQS